MKTKFLKYITRIVLIVYRNSLHRDLLNKLDKTKKIKVLGKDGEARMNRIDNAVIMYRKNPLNPPAKNKNNIIELQKEILNITRKIG